MSGLTPQKGKALLLVLIGISLLFLLIAFRDVVSYNFTQITIYSGPGSVSGGTHVRGSSGGVRAREQPPQIQVLKRPVPVAVAPLLVDSVTEMEEILPDEELPDDPALIINQVSCKIPRTEIMPKYFQKGSKGAWHTNWWPKCDYERELVQLEHDEFVRLLANSNFEDGGQQPSECCVREITRKENLSDQGYSLGECEPLRTSANVYGKQMLVVQCGDRLNFEATFPTNIPRVEEKLKFWNSRPAGERNQPISVLFLGYDSVSRSHAYRSLPKTLDYMTSSMDFIDFQGYHSTSGSTLTNFMAFLMGTPREDVRELCAKDWHSTFDSCPLIWNEYDERKYVTMYIEDGSQTFNWGGQAGFKVEPTDYYVHPLFNALLPLRKNHSPKFVTGKWKDDHYAFCASNETVPQWMMRYTQRFAEKFSAAAMPFFGYTFFAYPFHDDIYSLSSVDDDFLRFMQALQGNTQLLENTMIVLVSDHGDRTSFFHSASIEAYIERALPPLFIRIPEALKRRFPEFDEAMRYNTKRLVTPYDLYHTFRHLLHLGPGSESFSPVLSDRSSLLVKVAGNRTCRQLHLYLESCACNTATHVEAVSNPFILNKLMPFVQNTLNGIVKASGYVKVCAKWETDVHSILSSQVLTETTKSTDVLLKFVADPFEAHFEAKIRIHHKKSEFDKAELLGSFTRINMYGEQSFCIEANTDQDKAMKELCVCKSLVKGEKKRKKPVK